MPHQLIYQFISNSPIVDLKPLVVPTSLYFTKQELLENLGENITSKKIHSTRKLTVEQFETKAKKVHGNKYLYYRDYENNHKKIKITCLGCGKDFWQTPNSHLAGRGCPNCAIIMRAKNQTLTWQEFEEKVMKLHKGKYKYYHDYVNNRTKIRITCLGCRETFFQRPNDHSMGKGCPNCGGTKTLTWQEFEEKVMKLHKGKYKYYHDYVNNKQKIKITCLGCGITFFQRPNDHSMGKGCPNCAIGKNENLTGEILRELFHNNIDEATFHDKTIIQLPSGKKAYIDYKFEVNGQIIFVEYHGAQHYRPVTFGGMSLKKATKYFKEYQKPKDRNLRKYCKKNNILLFEIDGRKYTGPKIRQYIIDHIIPKIKVNTSTCSPIK